MEIELQLNSGSSYVKTIQTNMKVWSFQLCVIVSSYLHWCQFVVYEWQMDLIVQVSEEKAVKLNIEIHRLEEENRSLR